MLAAISDVNQFLLTTAAMLGAAATIVASIRVLAKIKVFAWLGRTLVGNPLRHYFYRAVSDSPLADEVRDFARIDQEMHAEQRDFNQVVDERLSSLEEAIRNGS